MIFIGVDGEMTSSELSLGAKLCQIGVSTKDGDTFTSIIGWPLNAFYQDATAMAVHGISVEDITGGPAAPAVDAELYKWLIARGANPTSRGATIPVGFNVGSFDLPFINDALPLTASLLSRRVVDLNGVVFSLAASKKVYQGMPPSIAGWKRLAKNRAAEILKARGIDPAWHDAGYDAAVAITAWSWLVERIAE